ncbi:uncharacterized protein LOC119777799 [Cyprinodon tularosa]|uniref:uncharacterized protein LOC119777799 n=1 Tax=Cyprinodon tularosa TaxID=77115 RepID=UPI0018E2887B|nr:uncharacterized protein LOC119777799 [Cyprinodon tularosa]
MPRKGQRSQSQKLRRQKEREWVNVLQSGEKGNHSVSSTPEVQPRDYLKDDRGEADVVKGFQAVNVIASKEQQVIASKNEHGQHDGESPGPSNEPAEPQPSVKSVCASRSQASFKYGNYRNKQCMANCLVFLSFVHEHDFITKDDLNRVLDKGHAMYSDVRKIYINSIFLEFEELPTVVKSRSHEYQVDMSQPIRHGLFDGGPDALSLEQGLQCLRSEVQYALLLMTSTCIAVCRLSSGEYAYFDPHPRKSTGLPFPSGINGGKAVQLKFSRLDDMIARIKLVYRILGTASDCQYDIKPITFQCEDFAMETLDYIQTTTNVEPMLDEPVWKPNTETSTEQTQRINIEATCVKDAVRSNDSCEVTSPRMDSSSNETTAPMSHCPSDPLLQQTLPSYVKEIHVTSHVSKNDSNKASGSKKTVFSDLPESLVEELNRKMLKRSKNEKLKIKRRLLTQLELQRNESDQIQDENVHKKNLYKQSSRYKENKKEYLRRIYKEKDGFKEKKKAQMRAIYREREEVRDKKREHLRKLYKESTTFREKQKERVKSTYRINSVYREKQKERVKRTYRECPAFREKQKERET